MVAAKAEERGIIDNQTLAYFIARVYLFLVRIGVKPSHIRFRQHLKTGEFFLLLSLYRYISSCESFSHTVFDLRSFSPHHFLLTDSIRGG